MQFEELSGIWNSTDPKLEETIRINRELVKQLGFSKVKSHLSEIKGSAIFEIVTETIFLIFLMSFIFEVIPEIKFLVPAVLLLVFSLISLILEILKLKLFFEIDSRQPVFEAQRRLAKLKYLEIIDAYSLFILIPLFGLPFLIVMAKAISNLDLYELGIMNWMTYSIVAEILIAALIVFFLRKFQSKKLEESIAFLNELKEH